MRNRPNKCNPDTSCPGQVPDIKIAGKHFLSQDKPN